VDWVPALMERIVQAKPIRPCPRRARDPEVPAYLRRRELPHNHHAASARHLRE
jgi:hypothetical protein